MRYFRNVLVIIFTLAVIFFVSGVVSNNVALAAVDKMVFLNDPQTIPTGQSSERYQIQLQNSSGGIEKAPDTTYFTLPLDLGQFSSAKDGTPFTAATKVYISTGDSNKYFYFKSDTAGTYILKVTATNKDGTKTWDTEQTVVVGSSTTPPTDPETPPTATTKASTTITIVPPTVIYSVHYIQESLSDFEEVTTFEVSVGRERLSYINSPISFEAKKKTSANLKNSTPDYIWSFGDGSSATTEKVIHVYKYPGEYNVVLNATLDGINSVTRTKVKVLIPNLALSVQPDGAVNILNKSGSEINLYGWKIQAGTAEYSFPLDTIVSAGKSVIFPTEYTKISSSGNQVSLLDASNKEITTAGINFANNVFKEISAADLEKFAVEYKRLNQPRTYALVKPVVTISTAPTSQDSAYLSNEGEGTTTPAVIPLTAAVADAIINTKEDRPGFWGKLFHPVRTIKETFYQ